MIHALYLIFLAICALANASAAAVADTPRVVVEVATTNDSPIHNTTTLTKRSDFGTRCNGGLFYWSQIQAAIVQLYEIDRDPKNVCDTHGNWRGKAIITNIGDMGKAKFTIYPWGRPKVCIRCGPVADAIAEIWSKCGGWGGSAEARGPSCDDTYGEANPEWTSLIVHVAATNV